MTMWWNIPFQSLLSWSSMLVLIFISLPTVSSLKQSKFHIWPHALLSHMLSISLELPLGLLLVNLKTSLRVDLQLLHDVLLLVCATTVWILYTLTYISVACDVISTTVSLIIPGRKHFSLFNSYLPSPHLVGLPLIYHATELSAIVHLLIQNLLLL